jgi:hypothetical protein
VLSLSQDNGESWVVRTEPFNVRSEKFTIAEEILPTLISTWKPWASLGLTVETRLIPPSHHWPGWHIRVHTISCAATSPEGSVTDHLICLDSGFSVSAQNCQGQALFETPCRIGFSSPAQTEGWWRDSQSCLVVSEAGASGVINLSNLSRVIGDTGQNIEPDSKIIRPDANTNIMFQRTLIPAIQHKLVSRDAGKNKATENNTLQIITGVFGARRSAEIGDEEMWAMWKSPPSTIV